MKLDFSFDVPDDKADAVMDFLLGEAGYVPGTPLSTIQEKVDKLKEIRISQVKNHLVSTAVEGKIQVFKAQAEAAVDQLVIE